MTTEATATTETIESRFVATPYGRFPVEATGQGEPLLFIHGGTASAREWRAMLPALGRHARCVALDRLGCGESDRSAGGDDRATITACPPGLRRRPGLGALRRGRPVGRRPGMRVLLRRPGASGAPQW